MTTDPRRPIVDAAFEVITPRLKPTRRRRIRGKFRLFMAVFGAVFVIGTAIIIYASPRTHTELPVLPVKAFKP